MTITRTTDDGRAVTLPVAWTPVRRLKISLLDLFRLWQQDKVLEVAYESDGELIPLHDLFPAAERRWDRFGFDEACTGFVYLETWLPLPDLHIRAKPAVEPVPSVSTATAPSPVATPATSQHRRQKGETDRARAKLLYEAAKSHAGSETWSTATALNMANKEFRGNPLLKAKEIRSFSAAWQLAKRRLRIDREEPELESH